MGSNNICFHGEIRKIISKPPSNRTMHKVFEIQIAGMRFQDTI